MNVSVLMKFSPKTSVFYLKYHKISIKSYVMDVFKNRLGEAILIHIHSIWFLWRNIEKYHFLSFSFRPQIFPIFTLCQVQIWGYFCTKMFPWGKSLSCKICPCHKIGQGPARSIIWTNYDGLEFPMLHTKFRRSRPTGAWEEYFF